MKKTFEIKSDCLDIVERIKAIDADYFVMFDLDAKKFQLHNRAQKRSTYCLTFPFDTLDERAVTHVLKTRVQNSDELFKRLEEENARLEKAKTKEVLNDFLENFEEKHYESFRRNQIGL